MPGGQRRAIDRLARREQRRRAADARRVFADHLHVLLPGRDPHGEIVAVVAVLDHHRGAQFEHARIARARLDQLEDLRRIEPGLHAEHHRLGARDVVDRDQQVGDELHLHAVAEAAEIMRLAREVGEQRHQAVDRLRVAARIDHEVLGARLRAGAAQRAIEHHVAGLAQHALGRRLVVEREGGKLRDDAARQFRRDDRLDGCRSAPRASAGSRRIFAAFAATAAASSAISTPAAFASAQRAASMS